MAVFDLPALWGRKTLPAPLETKAGEVLPVPGSPGGYSFGQYTDLGWRDPGRPDTTPTSLVRRYIDNAAVYVVMNRLANAYVEPELKVYRRVRGGKPVELEDHPLKALLDKPNIITGQAELLRFHISFMSLGGDGFIYKQRPPSGGPPAALWPYHRGWMWPVPGDNKWINFYAYNPGTSAEPLRVETLNVIQEKWSINPVYPWLGMSATEPVIREIASDSELTRFVQALLFNDAVMRGYIKMPPGAIIDEPVMKRIKEAASRAFSGNKRGGMGVLEGGAEYVRVALNMQELAVDGVRASDEARIAEAFGVPVEISGLSSTASHRTYSNYQEARTAFAEQTLVPRWKSLESELNSDLAPEYGDDIFVAFDLNAVRALQESTDAKRKWTIEGWKAGLLTFNEAREEGGLDAVTDKVLGESYYVAPPAPGFEQAPAAPVDAAVVDPNATQDGNKALVSSNGHKEGGL